MPRALSERDMITAIRIDETALCAVLDISPRPVHPRRLH